MTQEDCLIVTKFSLMDSYDKLKSICIESYIQEVNTSLNLLYLYSNKKQFLVEIR